MKELLKKTIKDTNAIRLQSVIFQNASKDVAND